MNPSNVVVALHPAVLDREPEIHYVFRTLMGIAGFPVTFVRGSDVPSADVVYAPTYQGGAALFIEASNARFGAWCEDDPSALREVDGLVLPEWDGRPAGMGLREGHTKVGADLVRVCYWLLTGAGESPHRRDRWDNIDLEGSFLLRSRLLERPLVSLYGSWLRDLLKGPDRQPLDPPWAEGDRRVGFAMTHDVDYPEVIRWIEILRVAGSRAKNRGSRLRAILQEQAPFWRFQDWVELAKRYGGRPAFYFMAARGSLPKYVMGTPDAFYDITKPRFRSLFAQLRDQGCEVGLHASYRSYRSSEQLRQERSRLEDASKGPVPGNRHHYWHMDPDAPHRTLRAHERAGLAYDSSLAFEYYPGFRRGICHPFRPYDPEERRALDVVQMPPAWMDDHFYRRRARNGIDDPDASARRILDVAKETGGVVVVDYHVRGMNRMFFPHYGAWIEQFLECNVDSTMEFSTPAAFADQYRYHQAQLQKASWSGA